MARDREYGMLPAVLFFVIAFGLWGVIAWTQQPTSSGGLSGGAKIGIVIGSFAGLVILGSLLYYFYKRDGMAGSTSATPGEQDGSFFLSSLGENRLPIVALKASTTLPSRV
jgi:hypothetical protein